MGDAGLRLLIVGVGENTGAPSRWDPLPVEDLVRRLRKVLAPFDPEVVEVDAFPAPTAGNVQAAFNRWFFDDEEMPDKDTFFYWVGHASFEDSALRLVTKDSKRALINDRHSYSSVDLADALRVDWRKRSVTGVDCHWVVVALDCCSGGKGIDHIVQQFDVSNIPDQLGLIGSGGDDGASAGRLLAALERFFDQVTFNDSEIRLSALLTALQEGGEGIRANSAHLGKRGLTPVLLNRQAAAAPVVSTEETRRLLEPILKTLGKEARDHFFTKAQGTEFDQTAWYFTGRSTESEQLAAWVDDPTPGIFVVTGRAGCGKSALLGRMMTVARPELLGALVDSGLTTRPPEREVPGRPFDVAVHLAGKSLYDATASLAAALPGYEGPPGDLGAVLDAVGRRPEPFVVLADALDEAQDPLSIASSWARRLAATDNVKLLLGTRRSLAEGPDQPDPAERELLEALVVPEGSVLLLEDEPDAIEAYARERLRETPSSKRAAELAQSIREQHEPFLFARLAVLELGTRPELGDAEVHELLSGGHRGVFVAALRRLAESSRTTVPLLRALAHAQGRGVPRWDEVWASVSRALAPGLEVPAEAVSRVLQEAAPYIAHDGEDGQATYRPAHRTFVEHFEAEGDQAARHRAITEALAGGRRETGWADANPYLTRHLQAHATIGGCLDDLVTDPGFLVAAVPEPLLGVLRHTKSEEARTAGAVYRLAVHKLRMADSSEHPSYLELAGRQFGANDFADEVARRFPARPWSVPWARWRAPAVHQNLPGHASWVLAVAVGEVDGVPVAVSGGGDDDRSVRVWDLRTGAPRGAPLEGHAGSVRAVAVGKVDGVPVAVSGGSDCSVRVWDLRTGAPRDAPLEGHEGWVLAVAVGKVDGVPVAVSGGSDCSVRVWDLRTGAPRGAPLEGHEGWVLAVAVGEVDGVPVAVSGGSDGRLLVWDLRTGAPRGAPLEDHVGSVRAVAVGKVDGVPVAVSGGGGGGGDDRSVRVWDLRTGAPRGAPLEGHEGWVLAVAVGEMDGVPVAVSGDDDCSVRVWDLRTGAPRGAPLEGHAGWVLAVAVGEVDGVPVAVSGGDDRSVRVWDLRTGAPRGAPLEGHEGWVRAVAVGKVDGVPVAVSGGSDCSVRVWDLRTGAPRGAPLEGHEGWVLAVAVGEVDGVPVAVSGDDDCSVRVWDLRTGAPRGAPLEGHAGWVLAVAVGEVDGVPVAVSGGGDDDRSVRVWDLRTGAPRGAPLEGHAGSVRAVAVGKVDGVPVAVSGGGGDDDRSVRVWDLRTGAPRGAPLEGHEGWVLAVAVGEVDGVPVAVSGGSDCSVRVWDLRTGAPRGAPLEGHEGRVLAVAVGEVDGVPVAVSGGSDGRLLVWDLRRHFGEGVSSGVIHIAPPWSAEVSVGVPIEALALASSGVVVVGTKRGLLELFMTGGR